MPNRKPRGQDTPALDGLAKEIEELREAREILQDLWRENLRNHRSWQVPSALLTQIHRYFGHDEDE